MHSGCPTPSTISREPDSFVGRLQGVHGCSTMGTREVGGDSGGEGRIARSWRLSRTAWRLVGSDRAILVLALFSTLLTTAALAVVYDADGLFSGHRQTHDSRLLLATLILAYPLTFMSVYFNTAIASAASAVLDGRRLTVRQALAVPTRRLGQVALWSLLVAGVGVIVDQLASRLPLAGSIAARLFGLTWSLASMFAVPILAVEGCSAPACLSHSARLVKKRWGEGISGNVIITGWMIAAILPISFGLAIGLAASRGAPGARIAVISAAVVAFVLVVAASAVVRQTFAVVLYRYATTGAAAGGFSASDLEAPFSPGLIRGRNRAVTQTRRLPSAASVRLWLLAAVSSAVLTSILELNKHHYTTHELSGRILNGVMIWVVFTLGLRLLLAAVARAARWLRVRQG